MAKLFALIVALSSTACAGTMTKDISDRDTYKPMIGRAYETKRDLIALVFTDFEKKVFTGANIPAGTVFLIRYVYLVNGSKTYFADIISSENPTLKDRIMDTSGWIDHATNKRRWGPPPSFKTEYVQEIATPISYQDFLLTEE